MVELTVTRRRFVALGAAGLAAYLAKASIDQVLKGTRSVPGNSTPTLSNEQDVLLSNPANNDVLTFDTTLGKWKNKPSVAGGTDTDYNQTIIDGGAITMPQEPVLEIKSSNSSIAITGSDTPGVKTILDLSQQVTQLPVARVQSYAGIQGVSTFALADDAPFGFAMNVKSKTFANSPYTMTTADMVIMWNATGGASTINLPASTNSGMVVLIMKTDASANAVTITRSGSDTIEGATSLALTTQWSCALLIARAGNSWIRSKDLPHNILSAQHADAVTASVVRGDIILGNSTPAWARKAIGTVGQYLRSDGTDLQYSAIVSGDVTSSNHGSLGSPSDHTTLLDLAGVRAMTGTAQLVAGIGSQVVNKTGTYSATKNDSFITADATSAAFTVTLPAANAQKGLILCVQKTDSSVNAVTIARAGSDTLNGGGSTTSFILLKQYNQVILIADGTSKWIIIDPPQGTKILLNADEVETTGTITTASAKTFSLPANTFSKILVEAWVEYDFVAASVFITFALQIDGANTDHSAILRIASTSGFNANSPLSATKTVTAASTTKINVTVTTGTATWRIMRMLVWGVV